MSDKPTVSVIIPAYKPNDVLARSIAMLRQQTYPANLTEIIIVDDCSPNPVADMIPLAGNPAVTVIRHEANRGRAAARNTGLAHAANDVLIFLDSDVIPDEYLIETHARKYHPTDKALYFGTFRWHPEVKTNHFTRFGRWFEYDCVLDKPELDFIDFHGANFSVTRPVLTESGITFEEQFTKYGMEDLEFGLLLKKQGFRFDFLPDAVVWHHREATLEEQVRRARESAESIVYFLQKHPEEKVFRSLHYISPQLFEKYSPVLRSAHDCAQRLLASAAKKLNPSPFEQEMVAACGILLIEYAPWDALYSNSCESHADNHTAFSYKPSLKDSAIDWAHRVHFLDRILRGDDTAKQLYNAFIEPLDDTLLRQSLCHEAGRYFILSGQELEAIRILTIGSRHTTDPNKEAMLIRYLLGSSFKKRGEIDEAHDSFRFVIDNGKPFLHASQYASALYHMGDIYANYYIDSATAHRYFEQAITVNPHHRAAREALTA